MERWKKAGADDVIVASGIDSIRSRILSTLQVAEPRDLDEYRNEILDARTNRTLVVTIDRSETGAGKTTSDTYLAARHDSSASFVPTHKNGEELQQMFTTRHQMAVEKYPQLSADTCLYYDVASDSMNRGFMPSSSICPTCIAKSHCEYQSGYQAAKNSMHVIGTHKRGEIAMDTVTEGKAAVIIQEDGAGILCRTESEFMGFQVVAEIAESTAVEIAKGDR